EDASDELLSRGDAELLVEVLDVVLDAVTLFEQLGLRTVPGQRLLARLLASRARCLSGRLAPTCSQAEPEPSWHAQIRLAFDDVQDARDWRGAGPAEDQVRDLLLCRREHLAGGGH